MTIPNRTHPEYQKEVGKWRQTWGYDPQRDQIVRILAKRELKEALQRLFDEFRVAYNISASEFKHAAIEASQHLIRQATSEEAGRRAAERQSNDDS